MTKKKVYTAATIAKIKARKREYRLENKEKFREYYRNYEKTEKRKAYKEANKEKFKKVGHINYKKRYASEEYRNKLKIQHKKYWEENKQWLIPFMGKYEALRSKIDLNFKLRKTLRTRIAKAVRDSYKKGSAIRDLGCSVEDLKIHLEKQFQPGMSWDNYGEWHIDHIFPLSKFDLTNRDQFLKACHYTNLQPLWAIDNIRKGNKVPQDDTSTK